jgi:hypothetical protein
MSYQPPAPTPMTPTAPPPPAPAARKKLWTVLGLAALVGGLGLAAALFVMSTGATGDAVKKFARAPVNCSTTLDFDETGEYIFFIETKGRTGDVGGDCDANDESYDSVGDNPKADLVLLDGDDEIDLDRADDISYDADGFVGEATRVAQIEDTGTYRLRVESEDEDFAVAVGRDPGTAASNMRTGAIAAGVGGLALGGLFFFLGRKRKPAMPAAAPAGPGFGPAAYEPPYLGAPAPPSAQQPAGPQWAPAAPQQTPPSSWQPAPPPPAPPVPPAPAPAPAQPSPFPEIPSQPVTNMPDLPGASATPPPPMPQTPDAPAWPYQPDAPAPQLPEPGNNADAPPPDDSPGGNPPQ